MDASATPLPMIAFLIPLAGIVLLVVGSLLTTRKQEGPWWRCLPRPSAGLVVLAFLAVWCAIGLVTATVPELVGTTVALVACGLVSQVRPRVQRRLPQGRAATVVRHVLLLVLATVLACLALELPWNPGVLGSVPTFWWLELGMVGTALVALYFLGQRRGTLVSVGVIACLVIGLAQYFIELFKGAAIMPSDLYSLGTAAAVSGNYEYLLAGSALAGICCAVAGMTLVGYLRPVPQDQLAAGKVVGRRAATESSVASSRHSRLTVVVSLAIGLALAGGLAAFVRHVPFSSMKVKVEYFFTLDKYREQGFLPSFVVTWQDMPIRAPEGYTTDGAEELEAELAAETPSSTSSRALASQFDEVQPTVIAVMNETFSDLSDYSGIAEAGYEGPQYYNSISDALERGTLYVSAYGGGTCNTEFEFLTGVSMAFVGGGKYPYSQYNLAPIDNLARQFKELGYTTTAMHPNLATNWSRNKVYANLGFDTFYSIDDFEGAETFHSGVTDRATYDKVLELLEEDDGPQFIFDVTMQNHSGYDQGNIPEDRLTGYQPEGEGITEADNAELNEYLSCIEASDQDLEYLMGRLEELDRPVVLVFFGDHQPNVTTPYNDAYYPDEDSVIHAERAYHTTYFLWANYDVVGNAQQSERLDTSTNYLGALLMSSIGAPTSEYEDAQLTIREAIPALNLYGYQGADGEWYALASDGAYADTFDDEEWISYLEFGSKV